MLEKRRRQHLLRHLLTERGYRSQAALAAELRARGFLVHRTTVGADLRDLGASFRRRSGERLPTWHLPSDRLARHLDRDRRALDEVLRVSGLSADMGGVGHVLVWTRRGHAERVARAVLESEIPCEQIPSATAVQDELVLVQLGRADSDLAQRLVLRLGSACHESSHLAEAS